MGTDTSLYDKYEKLIQFYLLCKEIIQVCKLYEAFKGHIQDRNAHELSVILDRMFFDFIVINWAKLFGPKNESLHLSNVFEPSEYINAKEAFLSAIQYDEKQYSYMHTHLLTWRDKIIAHFDFQDAYNVNFCPKYFSKIPIQCESIVGSVIQKFKDDALKFPDMQCGIPLANGTVQNKSLAEIAKDLELNFANEIDTQVLKKMLDALKDHCDNKHDKL